MLSQPNPVRPLDPYIPKAQLTYPAETPNVRSTKSHVLFPLLKSSQRISPGSRRFETFRNNKNLLWWEVVSPRLNPPTPPSWRTTPCRLSATAYSVYSQLPSVTGGLPYISNLRTRQAVVTRDPQHVCIVEILHKLCGSVSPRMGRSRIMNRGDGLQMRRVAADIFDT
jgi:hypothetical protein